MELPPNMPTSVISNLIMIRRHAKITPASIEENNGRWSFSFDKGNYVMKLWYKVARGKVRGWGFELLENGEKVDTDDLLEALQMIMGAPQNAEGGSSRVAGESSAKANTSVQTRRATVIRV